MWIFVNMIMINVWLFNKKLNKSVKLPFSVLKVSLIWREFCTNTKLERVQLSLFHTFLLLTAWLQLQKSIANSSGKYLRVLFFVSTTRKEPLSTGKFNFKLRNMSFISAPFDSWQISVFELHRSVLVVKLNHFSSKF